MEVWLPYRNKSKVRDLRNKTVPTYKIDVLVEKEIFTHRRRFVCDDCLNKYARDEDETVNTCEFRYEAPLYKNFNLMMRIWSEDDRSSNRGCVAGFSSHVFSTFLNLIVT